MNTNTPNTDDDADLFEEVTLEQPSEQPTELAAAEVEQLESKEDVTLGQKAKVAAADATVAASKAGKKIYKKSQGLFKWMWNGTKKATKTVGAAVVSGAGAVKQKVYGKPAQEAGAKTDAESSEDKFRENSDRGAV